MTTKSKAFSKFCEKQIMRLQVLDFFTTLDEIGRGELSKALVMATANESENRAEKIIDICLGNKEKFPKPSEIYAIGRQLEEDARSSLPPPCEECSSSIFPGYVFTEYVVDGIKNSALVACRCARGRAMAEGARRVKAEDQSGVRRETLRLERVTAADKPIAEIILDLHEIQPDEPIH